MSKLIVTLIFITHCCACSWHYLGVFERDTLKIHRNWLTYYEFEDLEWLERFVYYYIKDMLSLCILV